MNGKLNHFTNNLDFSHATHNYLKRNMTIVAPFPLSNLKEITQLTFGLKLNQQHKNSNNKMPLYKKIMTTTTTIKCRKE